MTKQRYICGIDIGSQYVRVVAGDVSPESGDFYILGAFEVPSEGISKGMISSIENAVSSVTACLEGVERMTGIPIKQAYVGISGNHIISMHSKGVVAVSRANGEIQESDVERVIDAAQAVATPANYEILHVIPRSFTIDHQIGIKDPVGMTGVRLEVDTEIIQGLSTQIKNVSKVLFRAGVAVEDLVVGSLACAESALSKRQKELGVAILNMGSQTTSVAVFEDGDLVSTFVLPLGSAHITNDIAIGLRTSIDVAERIKLECGTAVPDEIGKKEVIHLSDFSSNEDGEVLKRHVAEIIEARVEELFGMVDREFTKLGKSGLLPAGIVITGGGAKLPGILEVAKRKFRLPASVGFPQHIQTAIDKVNDVTFTTAIGLALWGFALHGASESGLMKSLNIRDVFGRVKEWLKQLLP